MKKIFITIAIFFLCLCTACSGDSSIAGNKAVLDSFITWSKWIINKKLTQNQNIAYENGWVLPTGAYLNIEGEVVIAVY